MDAAGGRPGDPLRKLLQRNNDRGSNNHTSKSFKTKHNKEDQKARKSAASKGKVVLYFCKHRLQTSIQRIFFAATLSRHILQNYLAPLHGSYKADKAVKTDSKCDSGELQTLFAVAETVVFSNRSKEQHANQTAIEIPLRDLRISTSRTATSTRSRVTPQSNETGPVSPAFTTITTTLRPTRKSKNHRKKMGPGDPLWQGLTYRQRCEIDSDALLKLCPQHLRGVNQTFLRQAEAFALADQCNQGLPILPEPTVLLSTVTAVPDARASAQHTTATTGSIENERCAVGRPSVTSAPLPGSQSVVRPENAAHGACPANQQGHALSNAAEPPQQPHASLPFSKTDVHVANDTADAGANGQGEPPSVTVDQEGELQRHRERAARARERSEAEKEKRRALHARFEAALEALNQPRDISKVQTVGANQVNGSENKREGRESNSCAAMDIPPNVKARQQEGVTDDSNPATATTMRVPGAHQTGGKSSHCGGSRDEYAERRAEAIRVFCVERLNERTGAYYRNFVTTSYSSVWQTYLESAPHQLHWYEVVREGRPCHLYFDLEYGRGPEWNQGIDGNALVDQLLAHVKALLHRNWGLTLELQRDVYELDSSTDKKFSRHVIVRIPGHAFFHNGAAGHFVTQILAAAGTALDVDKGPPPERQRVSFVDTAVYTRNRHFRLAYSCKGGKDAILRPTERYATAPDSHRPGPARVFAHTLLCHVEPRAKLLLVRPLQLTSRDGGETKSLLPGLPYASLQGEILPGGVCQVHWKHDGVDGPRDEGVTSSMAALKGVAERAVPFIERIARDRSGQEARARSVTFCGYDGTVAYGMIGPGSHYCDNVGRNHKSNFIYFVADFARGVFAQKCHDPDCCRFR